MFRAVQRTDVGVRRSINEDRVLTSPSLGVWAVIDGMGGHEGGEAAAQRIVDHLAAASGTNEPLSIGDLVARLSEANIDIIARNAVSGLRSGATVVAGVVKNEIFHCAWAGDSRAYHVSGCSVALLTRDHSVVQELVDAGVLRASEADRHPQSNVVTRALGIDRRMVVETVEAPFRPRDRIILCSDGLSRSLRESELASPHDIDGLADALIRQALERDGSDNISLVILERLGDE